MKITVINGPNMNLIGTRQPEVYGCSTLAEINEGLKSEAKKLGASIAFYQFNGEGEIIGALHNCLYDGTDAVLLNAAAYTHYSYAIRDAIAAVALPVFEVHMSDINLREKFRQTSVIADVCVEQIIGHGADSYSIALRKAVGYVKQT